MHREDVCRALLRRFEPFAHARMDHWIAQQFVTRCGGPDRAIGAETQDRIDRERELRCLRKIGFHCAASAARDIAQDQAFGGTPGQRMHDFGFDIRQHGLLRSAPPDCLPSIGQDQQTLNRSASKGGTGNRMAAFMQGHSPVGGRL